MSRPRLSADALAAEIGRRTGHGFANPQRLERALTHASARKQGGSDYERLEFLGDRVLGLVIAEMLFSAFPAADEGELSVRLNQLVNAETCAAVAEELGIHEFIITGTEIKSLAGRKRMNLRADVMESLIATIYLDGGLDAARPFILAHWSTRATADGAARRDPKTALQEWAHQQGGAVPVYVVESREGPDHDPVFAVSVTVGRRPPERGTGRSKRAAEQEAATRLLMREHVWSEAGDNR
ncbi:MAG: ribonuclease III [Notoacmeibacter sp.]|nr:ribonuclease III [Notoacmeibacter sp.]